MLLSLLKSKIHKATVTAADLHYEGSIGIDRKLMDAAGLVPFEEVSVWNITNGQRVQTYAIPEEAVGYICLNGAAARLFEPGDLIIIASFCMLEKEQVQSHEPVILILDQANRITQTIGGPSAG